MTSSRTLYTLDHDLLANSGNASAAADMGDPEHL